MTEPAPHPDFTSHDEWQREVNETASNAASLWKHHSAGAAESELARLWRLFEAEPPRPTRLGQIKAKARRFISRFQRRL